MRTLDRYIKRIFIPLLAVALVGLALRWTMVSRFAERNVRMADPEPAALEVGTAFSPENRDAVVDDLMAAADALDRSREIDPNSRAADARAAFLESIEKLRRADAESWESLRSEARARLEAYAKSLPEVGL